MPSKYKQDSQTEKIIEARRLTVKLSMVLYDFFPNISDTRLDKIEHRFNKIIREELMEAKRE